MGWREGSELTCEHGEHADQAGRNCIGEDQGENKPKLTSITAKESPQAQQSEGLRQRPDLSTLTHPHLATWEHDPSPQAHTRVLVVLLRLLLLVVLLLLRRLLITRGSRG